MYQPEKYSPILNPLLGGGGGGGGGGGVDWLLEINSSLGGSESIL